MGWFRAYDGISTDAKYLLIAQRSGQPVERVLAVWVHVLDCANQRDTSDRGAVDHLDPEAFAAFLQRPVEEIEAILAAMRAAKRDGSPGMIDEDHVTAWRKRQPAREDDGAAERKRRQRDRERAAQEGRDADADTQCPDVSRDVTHGPALQDKTRQDKTDSESCPPDGERGVVRRPRQAQVEPIGFREFYSAYPRHVARPKAVEAYGRAVDRASHERIMLGLDRAKRLWQQRQTATDKIPYPASWLNADRWEDDDAPKPATAPQAGPSRWTEVQRRRAAEQRCLDEGLNPHTDEGMARVAEILREGSDEQRRTA